MKRWIGLILALMLLCGTASAEWYWYYNPDGGSRYHSDANCPSVSQKYRPMKEITAGPALAMGLKECGVCVDVRGYMLQGDECLHTNAHCVQLIGASRPLRIVLPEEEEAWSLKLCPYCTDAVLAESLHADERWYDPAGGVHFHRGGADCVIAVKGAYDRRETVEIVDGQYRAREDGRLLMPCAVCRPYGESSKAVLYREKDGRQTLHTSA